MFQVGSLVYQLSYNSLSRSSLTAHSKRCYRTDYYMIEHYVPYTSCFFLFSSPVFYRYGVGKQPSIFHIRLNFLRRGVARCLSFCSPFMKINIELGLKASHGFLLLFWKNAIIMDFSENWTGIFSVSLLLISLRVFFLKLIIYNISFSLLKAHSLVSISICLRCLCLLY